MQPSDRDNVEKHDHIVRHCILCGQERIVPPGTREYERALRGEKFPFTCPECDRRAQDEVEMAGGTVDDPLANN